MKKVILSYDYELFFGIKSGSVKKTIIEPTYKLLDAMDSVGLKGNFFIDVLMIKMLGKIQDSYCCNDLNLIETQLKDIINRGHRVELHLHSHWFDAKYKGKGVWDFSDFSRYSLYSFDKNEIDKMFYECVSYLNTICSSVIPDYKVVAFRAGGWAVQPFANLKAAFERSGIMLDSSVAYQTYGVHENSNYDFRKAPNKEMYRFSDDVCIESYTGSFVEVPIYTIRRNLFDKVIDKLTRILTPFFKQYSDGTHCRNEEIISKSIKSEKRTNRSMFCLSFLNTISLLFRLLINNRNMICIIDHPKDINPMALLNVKVIGKLYNSILYKDLA